MQKKHTEIKQSTCSGRAEQQVQKSGAETKTAYARWDETNSKTDSTGKRAVGATLCFEKLVPMLF